MFVMRRDTGNTIILSNIGIGGYKPQAWTSYNLQSCNKLYQQWYELSLDEEFLKRYNMSSAHKRPHFILYLRIKKTDIH